MTIKHESSFIANPLIVIQPRPKRVLANGDTVESASISAPRVWVRFDNNRTAPRTSNKVVDTGSTSQFRNLKPYSEVLKIPQGITDGKAGSGGGGGSNTGPVNRTAHDIGSINVVATVGQTGVDIVSATIPNSVKGGITQIKKPMISTMTIDGSIVKSTSEYDSAESEGYVDHAGTYTSTITMLVEFETVDGKGGIGRYTGVPRYQLDGSSPAYDMQNKIYVYLVGTPSIDTTKNFTIRAPSTNYSLIGLPTLEVSTSSSGQRQTKVIIDVDNNNYRFPVERLELDCTLTDGRPAQGTSWSNVTT